MDTALVSALLQLSTSQVKVVRLAVTWVSMPVQSRPVDITRRTRRQAFPSPCFECNHISQKFWWGDNPVQAGWSACWGPDPVLRVTHLLSHSVPMASPRM